MSGTEARCPACNELVAAGESFCEACGEELVGGPGAGAGGPLVHSRPFDATTCPSCDAPGNDVTPAFRDYLAPLLGEDMPQAHRLRAPAVAKVLKVKG